MYTRLAAELANAVSACIRRCDKRLADQDRMRAKRAHPLNVRRTVDAQNAVWRRGEGYVKICVFVAELSRRQHGFHQILMESGGAYGAPLTNEGRSRGGMWKRHPSCRL